jgi:hypothetical protein
MSTSAPSRRLFLGTFAALPLAGLPAVLPVAATPADAVAAPNPDAEVVRLADDIAAIRAENERLSYIEEEIPNFRERVRWHETHIRPRTNRYLALLETLAAKPAVSAAGFRAKARIWLLHGNCAPGYAVPSDCEALAWSLANDVLGIESVWREEEDDEEEEDDTEEQEVMPQVRGPERHAQDMLNAVAFMWTKLLEAMAEPGSLLTFDRIREVLPIADDLALEEVRT